LVCNEDTEKCDPCTSDVECDDGIDCTIDDCNIVAGLCFFTPNDDQCPPFFICEPGSGCVVDAPPFASFTDPANAAFSTIDVHDVDGEIVRFHVQRESIVWAATGQEFQAGFWEVNGNLLGPSSAFQVRFGSSGGVRRAYFTETGPATICQIAVFGGQISISATNVPVPQE
jgi:hypothetical protein